MPTKRKRGAPTPAPFALPGEQEELMRDAYYRQLNEHGPFTAALAELRTRLALRFPSGTKRHEHDEEEPQVDGPWRPEDAWLPKKARAQLVAFVDRWRLPSLGNLDVLKSLRLSPPSGPMQICADHSPKIGASPHAFIQADQPPSFIYDPVVWTPAEAQLQARAAGDAVYRQMSEQIERANREWRAQGKKPLPPRSRSRGDLNEGARRLFQRVVLRWTWKRIADDVAARSTARVPRATDPSAIAEGVKRWARQLGVTLPNG